ncbi:MAG: hypothetical protein HC769_05560 [Cyanobacteria bacterium CRU_2_1]|nr:hypothetical protein [Cyanobacteria bacterium CRU_2_1]
MKRIICGAIALLSFPLIFTSPARSQSSEAELRELYQLCSQFPFNSRCEGYEIPIPLDNRSGARTNCSLEVNNPAETERCKIVISDGQLIAYVEVGEPIAPLDNQRGTEEISIPLSDIFAFEMRIWARRVDAGVVLIGGSLYSQQDEDYAGLERVYDPATDANELAAPANDRDFTEIAISYIVSSNAESDNRSNVLKIVSSEEFGFYLKEQITPTPPASGILVASQAPDTASSAPSGDLIQQLLDTKICVRCDLSNADLSDSDLEMPIWKGQTYRGQICQKRTWRGVIWWVRTWLTQPLPRRT